MLTCRFSTCELAYLPTFICNLKINTCGAFTVSETCAEDMCRVVKTQHLKCMLPAEIEQDDVLPSYLALIL